MASLLVMARALLQGAWLTLVLTVGASLLAAPVALLAGLARASPHRRLRWPATAYTELFRGTSALVQLFWCYYVLPFFGIVLSATVSGILVLGLNAAAYGAEIVRGGLQAVPLGQHQAAMALNMTPSQVLWRILLPQALPSMLPPFGNLLIELLKNTALTSLITLTELTFTAQLLRAETLHSVGIFSAILLIYFAMALVISQGIRATERWLAQRQGCSHNADN